MKDANSLVVRYPVLGDIQYPKVWSHTSPAIARRGWITSPKVRKCLNIHNSSQCFHSGIRATVTQTAKFWVTWLNLDWNFKENRKIWQRNSSPFTYHPLTLPKITEIPYSLPWESPRTKQPAMEYLGRLSYLDNTEHYTCFFSFLSCSPFILHAALEISYQPSSHPLKGLKSEHFLHSICFPGNRSKDNKQLDYWPIQYTHPDCETIRLSANTQMHNPSWWKTLK